MIENKNEKHIHEQPRDVSYPPFSACTYVYIVTSTQCLCLFSSFLLIFSYCLKNCRKKKNAFLHFEK